LLSTGAVDLPGRQRTLRATVAWSVGLLDDAERSLLEATAVFTDGWTIQAAAQVADMTQDEAVDLCEALGRHRLIYVGSAPRSRVVDAENHPRVRRRAADRTPRRGPDPAPSCRLLPDAGRAGGPGAAWRRAWPMAGTAGGRSG